MDQQRFGRHHTVRGWIVPTALAAALAVLAGCGGAAPAPSGKQEASAPKAAAPAGAKAPYLIGAAVSESGPGSSLGRPEADSIQLAVNEINQAGGVDGHPLKLTILDDKSDGTAAVNDVKQLLGEHVLAIIGGTLTPTGMPSIPLVQQAGIPYIALASAAEIIQPVSQHHWIFKIPPVDTDVARVMQAYMKARGLLRVGFLYRNDDYGKSGLKDFSAAGQAAGFQVVASEAMGPTATDVTTQLTRLRAANPQAIVVWSTPPSADVAAKDDRELGLKYPLFFSDGAANGVFLQLAGPAVNGSIVAGTKIGVADQLPAGDPQKQVLLHYIQAFQAAYPKDGPANMFGGFGYDATFILKNALAQAGPDPAKIRDALEQTSYSGVTGVFHMSPQDHNGLPWNSDVLARVVNQRWQLIQSS